MQDSYSKEFTEFKFPSPIGELHFSIFYFISPAIHARVSVPYRGATFLNSQVVLLAVIFVCVSVPYRGATFLNASRNSHKDGDTTVSVPYRGATFLNTRIINKKTTSVELFPSPIGELHFSIPSPQPHVLSGTNRGIAGEK